MCCNARRKIQSEGRIADLEAENARLQEARSCDVWLTNNLSLWMAMMMKAHRDSDRARKGYKEALKAIGDMKKDDGPNQFGLCIEVARAATTATPDAILRGSKEDE